jgi:hypothetical protein
LKVVADAFGDMERLNPRVQIIWALGALISAAILGGVASAILFFLRRDLLSMGIALFVVLTLLGLGHTLLRYRIWRFDVQTDALFLNRGVLTRVRTVVPYVRVQHVDTQRTPLERVFGLSSVVVYTAGSRGADVTIPGLVPDRATELQERLRQLVGERETDDAV